MSKRDRGTYLAIGFIAGIALASIFLVWSVPEFRSPTSAKQYYENWQAAAQSGDSQHQDDTHFWVREFHGWVFAEDSLAQWLMAILGVAATIISLYALIWLRRTWDQAKSSASAAWKAVDVTREMGEAQSRAYFRPTGIKFIWDKESAPADDFNIGFTPRIGWENCGISPAVNVFCFVDHRILEIDDAEEEIIGFVKHNNTSKMPRFFFTSGEINHSQFAHISGDDTELLYAGTHKLVFYSAVRYDDVFEQTFIMETCSVAVFPLRDHTKQISFRAYPFHNGYRRVSR